MGVKRVFSIEMPWHMALVLKGPDIKCYARLKILNERTT